MKTRIITGSFIFLAFALIAVTSLWLNGLIFDVFVLLLMYFGATEMINAFKHINAKPFYAPVFLLIFGGYAVFALTENRYDDGISFYFLALIAVSAVLLFIKLINKKIETNRILGTIFVMIYPVTIMMYMLGLNYMGDGESVYRSAGILLIFLVSPFTDSMAYFVGSALKGPKLCPKISPKKTVSGALGGLLGGMLGALIVYGLAVSGWLEFMGLGLFDKGIDVVHYLALGFLGAVATQAGDLIASVVKRRCGIKDYGHMLPGHGGIMDRVDGMIFSAVVFYIYFLFLGL